MDDDKATTTSEAGSATKPTPGLAEALADLLAQLEAVGIYIPGQDAGQWADAEGLSFAEAEAALKAAGVGP